MKLKKKMLAFLALGFIVALASCAPTSQKRSYEDGSTVKPSSTSTSTQDSSTTTSKEHIHSYGTGYESDETNHWAVCTTCKEKVGEAQHTFSGWKETLAPTESAVGKEERACAVCGYKETKDIEKLHTHSYMDTYSYDNTGHYYKCSGCDLYIEKADHEFGEWTEKQASTETEYGISSRTCSICGYEETKPIEKLDHTHKLSNYISDLNYHWQICTECQESVGREEHHDVNNICEVCGFQRIFNIEYDLVGGTATNPTTYSTLDETFTLNNPEKPGYAFTGWTGTNLNSPTLEVSISEGSKGNLSYTANYEPLTFDISYELNDGIVSNIVNYNIETETFTLNNPTKTGYTFTGWTGTNIDLPQKEVSIPKGTTGNLSFTANFEIVDYTITYDLAGGTNNQGNPDSFTIYDTVTLLAPTKENYDFTGWFDENDVLVREISGSLLTNVSLRASWSPKNYTITYRLNGSSVDNRTSYTVETETFAITNPEKRGNDFIGWTGSGITGTTKALEVVKGTSGNLVFEAIFEEIVYTITYDLDGGSVVGTNKATYTVSTDSFELADAAKSEYNFIGWTGEGYTLPTKGIVVQSGTIGDLSFTANYSVINYTITYDLDGGANNADNPGLYTYFDDITLKDAEKPGFTFIGWTNDDITTPTKNVEIKNQSGNLSYTANYTENTYTITYVLNDGVLDLGVTNVSSYTPLDDDFEIYNPSKYEYRFIGWSGYGTATTDELVITKGSYGNLTLTAEFEIVNYSIICNLDGGTAINRDTYNFKSETYTLVNPTKSGYEFIGWTGSNGKTPEMSVTITKGDIGDLEFNANYKLVTYKITYNLDGGNFDNPSHKVTYDYNYADSTPAVVDLAYGSKISIPDDPTRYGYVFRGWFTDKAGVEAYDFNGTISGDIKLYACWERANYEIFYVTNANDYITNEYELSTVGTDYDSVNSLYVYAQKSGVHKISYRSEKTSINYGFYMQIENITTKEVIKTNTLVSSSVSKEIEFELSAGDVVRISVYKNLNDGKALFSFDGFNAPASTASASGVASVTFNDSQNTNNTVNLAAGDVLERPVDPVKAGYVFRGWYLSESMNEIYNFDNTISGSLNLYAGWYSLLDTSSEKISPVNYPSSSDNYSILISNLESEGYTNLYFNITEDGEHKVYYASPSSYGYNLEIINVTTGDVILTNTEAVLSAYTEKAFNASLGDVILIRMYKKTVIVSANFYFGGWSINANTAEAVIGELYNCESDDFELLTPVKTGYRFTGYKTEEESTPNLSVTITSTMTGNKTYTATWSASAYVITYDLKGGSLATQNPVGYNTGDSFTLNNPTKTGYTFKGWIIDSTDTPNDAYTVSTTTSGDLDFIAVYEPITYTVTYDLNDNSVVHFVFDLNYGTNNILLDKELTRSGSFAYPSNPTREGYVFTGWYDSASCNNRFDFDEIITANTTVYAGWYNTNEAAYEIVDPSLYMTFDRYTLSLNSTKKIYFVLNETGNHVLYYANSSDDALNSYKLRVKNLTNSTCYTGDSTNEYSLCYSQAYSILSFTGNKADVIEITIDKTGYEASSSKMYFAGFTQNPSKVNYKISYAGNSVVLFDYGYNDIAKSVTIAYDKKLDKPATPTRDGYIFTGWYTTSTLDTMYDFDECVSDDMTLFAKWNQVAEESFTVIYPENYTDETGKLFTFNTETLAAEECFTYYFVLNETGTHYIYYLNGSSDDSMYYGYYLDLYKDTTKVIETIYVSNTTFTSFTFNGNASDVYKLVIKKRGESSQGKLYFAGFNTPTNNVTANVITGYNIESSDITIKNPVFDGYTFVGWTNDVITTPTKDYEILSGSTGNINLVANWTPNTYTITYNLNGGTLSEANPSTYNVLTPTFILNNPVKAGYTFKGWKLAGEDASASYKVRTGTYGDLVFEAIYESAMIAINVKDGYFDETGFSELSTTMKMAKYLEKYTIDPLSRDGYKFLGYSDENKVLLTNNLGESIDVLASTTPITIYTLWEAILYTVEFDTDGGSAISSKQVYYNQTVSKPSDPSKDSSSFDNWYIDDQYSSVYDFDTKITGNITLYAKWIPYVISDITSNSNKNLKLSDYSNNQISQTVFGLAATDSDGNDVPIILDSVTGTVASGETVTLVFKTNSSRTTTQKTITIENVKVYDEFTLTVNSVLLEYDNDGHVKVTFDAEAEDSFTNSIYISGELTEGTTTTEFVNEDSLDYAGGQLTLKLIAVDPAGNRKVALYELPRIVYDKDITYINDSDTLSASFFDAKALDKDGNELVVTMTAPVKFYKSTIIDVAFDLTTDTFVKSVLNIKMPVYGEPSVSQSTIVLNNTDDIYGKLKLYAKWSDTEISVNNNFEITGGLQIEYIVDGVSTKTNYYVANIELLSPTKANKYFAGWYYDSNLTIPVGSTIDLSYADYDALIELLGISAVDSFGGALVDDEGNPIKIRFVSGSFRAIAGTSVVFTFEVNDRFGNSVIVNTSEIKVYSASDIILNNDAPTAILLSNPLKNFNSNAIDTFEEECTVSYEITSGTLEAGQVVSIKLIATDAYGNTKESVVYNNVKVYDTPAASFVPYSNSANDFDENAFAQVVDSFNLSITPTTLEVVEAYTCGAKKVKVVATDAAGNVLTIEEVIYPTDHVLDDDIEEVQAKCLIDGYKKTTYSCEHCGYVEVQTTVYPAKSHDIDSTTHECKNCDYVLYKVQDNSVYFGYYPQTKETASDVIESLNTAYKTPLLSSDWVSYNYYASSNVTDCMYYIDVDTNNDGLYDYRGVYLKTYRPRYTTAAGSAYQDDNGYYIETSYWFKYELIKWNILSDESGKLYMISDLILDSQAYSSGVNSSTYTDSLMEAFLTDVFYNAAFVSDSMALIDGELTLLSYAELKSYYLTKSARFAKATDYAKIQGVQVADSTGEYSGNANWYISDVYVDDDIEQSRFVKYDGAADYAETNDTTLGVRPTITISL